MTRPSLLTVSIFALVASASIGVVNAQETDSQGETIVVTGTPLSVTEKRLRDCIARNCPPDEDIAATLAHAENQFLGGDYTGARSTIRKSIGRNKDEAKGYPVDVSGLYRAGATVDAHLGEHDDFLRSTVLVRDSLKAGLPETDPRILMAQLEVGDMRARLGFPDEAENYYKGVQKRADELGYPGVVALARLRLALLTSSRAEPGSDMVTHYRAEARKLYTSIINDYEGRAPNVVLVAKIAMARLDRAEGKGDSTTQLIAEYGPTTKAGNRPTLVFAPSLYNDESSNAANRAGLGSAKSDDYGTSSTLSQMPMELFDNHWADVGFWVRPDGTVGDVEVLRSSGHRDWLKPVFTAIKGRRYTQTDTSPGDPGFFMMERYTITSHYRQVTGTRLRQRSPIPRIEMLDLTVEPPKAEKASSGG